MHMDWLCRVFLVLRAEYSTTQRKPTSTPWVTWIFIDRISRFYTRICTSRGAARSLSIYVASPPLRRRIAASNIYTPQGSLDSEDCETHAQVPGDWWHGADIERWMPIELQCSNNYSTSAKNLRDYLRDYYNSKEGEVPWQWNMI